MKLFEGVTSRFILDKKYITGQTIVFTFINQPTYCVKQMLTGRS